MRAYCRILQAKVILATAGNPNVLSCKSPDALYAKRFLSDHFNVLLWLIDYYLDIASALLHDHRVQHLVAACLVRITTNSRQIVPTRYVLFWNATHTLLIPNTSQQLPKSMQIKLIRNSSLTRMDVVVENLCVWKNIASAFRAASHVVQFVLVCRVKTPSHQCLPVHLNLLRRQLTLTMQ